MTINHQTVLIVDDEKSNLKILSDLLRDDVRVILAKSGEQAIAKAEQYRPDLVLLDIVMPKMNGFDVIQHLKQQASTSTIPVIFVSALGDTDNEVRGFDLGACDYIQKPFQSSLVRARVKLHLQLAKQRLLLEKLANIDPLTAIANRRKFSDKLQLEWSRCQQDDRPLSLVMIDIDYFKQFNDRYGHAAGDEALSKVAQALEGQLERSTDFVARYGGEEFVLVLPDTDQNDAQAIVERCRAAVAALKIRHETAGGECLTISLGGATCSGRDGEAHEQLLQRADAMLYQAKQQGRDCVVWEEELCQQR
ncbi:diguanylate cyclase [Pokkaliibacter sp. MBI-7]|uniref:GGDEF domain-containing response regulator n=1 Tax=Pokkaliibacter sp. MBI-7 TaxID=3040600 RepID=UPI00244937BA|nr:diguanylate cyclase [Pokkaliibacter sp. MBI-7]MDH2432313.1 diguanylate cyclase [Pokkaliibacter sp. MBI-7]